MPGLASWKERIVPPRAAVGILVLDFFLDLEGSGEDVRGLSLVSYEEVREFHSCLGHSNECTGDAQQYKT